MRSTRWEATGGGTRQARCWKSWILPRTAAFRDHYLNVDFDLSDVMFVTTANQLEPIPAPLRDRMEIIHLDGYTEYEKVKIAQEHLVKRQLAANGLREGEVVFTRRGAAQDRTGLHAGSGRAQPRAADRRHLQEERGEDRRPGKRHVRDHAPTSCGD